MLSPDVSHFRNRYFFALDAALLCLTPFAALLLRLDGFHALPGYAVPITVYTVAALCLRLAVFYGCGLYRHYWRSATVEEMGLLLRAVCVATLAVCAAFVGVSWVGGVSPGLPRSLPLIDALLTLVGVAGSRFAVRCLPAGRGRKLNSDARRVLICGAGGAGQMIAREMKTNPQLAMRPVGFVDDDPNKQGMHVLNLPVLGRREHLAAIVRDHAIAQVIIAMPCVSGKTVREFLELCEQAEVPARTVPGMYEILGGKVSVNQLRDVDIDDLLRREPIQTDIAAVRELVRGKRVLVTGGGGSIGSELCRQLLSCGPASLALLGHGENSVFEVHNELKDRAEREGSETSLHCFVADIRFKKRVYSVFRTFEPDIVFHAAAHKHVPLMEANPTEAISNNVFGTKNLLDAAAAHGVQNFVMISTDKVVNPSSVMGASKRIAEMLVMRAARESGRAFVAVRFGNVLGSRGSVVPTFKKQIAAGGPVTVSDPEMTRYFMTIPEAVQLVLQASVLGNGGEIFMLDMGTPVKIVDLARDLIELSGLEVGRDIDIKFTGARPGEKMAEELLREGETYLPTRHEKVRLVNPPDCSVSPLLDAEIRDMERSVQDDDAVALVNSLRRLIPEFRGQGAPPVGANTTTPTHAQAVVTQEEPPRSVAFRPARSEDEAAA